MQGRTQSYYGVLLSIMLIYPSLSSAAFSFNFIKEGRWYKQVEFGYGYLINTQNQTIQLATTPAPGLVNRYSGNSGWGTLYLSSSLGKRYAWTSDKSLSLGLEGDILANTDVNGSVHPLVNVANNFDRLNYHYELKSYALMAKGEIEKTFKPKLKGYISAGLGGALNQLRAYHETVPTGSTARPMAQPFANKTKGDVAFSLGTGLRYQVNDCASWGIGYRYLDTGKGKLNPSSTQSTSQAFQTKRLAHHLITFSLTT